MNKTWEEITATHPFLVVSDRVFGFAPFTLVSDRGDCANAFRSTQAANACCQRLGGSTIYVDGRSEKCLHCVA